MRDLGGEGGGKGSVWERVVTIVSLPITIGSVYAYEEVYLWAESDKCSRLKCSQRAWKRMIRRGN